MSSESSGQPLPRGYREQTAADFFLGVTRAEREEREALALLREAEERHKRDRRRGYTDDEADVDVLVVEAQELIVPSLRWFEAELAETPFLILSLAKSIAASERILQREEAHWSVYVVLLSRLSLEEPGGHRSGRPGMPCVYVGQTWHSPEYRFEQHKARIDGRASRYVRDWGLALLPEVYVPYNPLKRDLAPMIEEKLADALHQLGCTVFGGH